MKKIIAVLATAAILSACSSTPADNWQQHTTPRAGGSYSADAKGTSADNAKQNALLVARAACKAEGGRLSVISEDSSYHGPKGTEAAMTTAAKIGLLLYAKNTGKGAYVGAAQDYHHLMEFTCDTKA